MSEMKFEDTRGRGGSLGNSNTLDNGNVISDENMARTAVRGDIVQPLGGKQAANRSSVPGTGGMGSAGVTGAGTVQSQPVLTAVTGLSLAQQQKLLQDMETMKKRLEKEMLERRHLETELAERNQKEREHLEEEAKKELKRRDNKEVYTTNKVAISNWFLTICYLKIPIINIIYFLCTLISRKTPQPKKAYVLAWVVFQVLCLALAALLIYFVIQFGADFIDNILKYIPH